MAQTYAEFKAHVTDFLWRKNDTDLANAMDTIIRMADAELNRKLNIQRREVSVTIAPETEDHPLPDDFYQVMSLTDKTAANYSDPMQNTTKQHVEGLRTVTNSTYTLPFYYPHRGESENTLYLIGPFSAENPGSFSLQYRKAIPNFAVTDASWVEADYLDLYTYAVLKHAGIYAREDQRVQQYDALMTRALAEATDEDLRNVRFGGSPLHVQPHHYIPQTRRR